MVTGAGRRRPDVSKGAIRALLSGSNRAEVDVDALNHALTVQDEVHRNIHRGIFFTTSDLVLALTADTSEEILLVTTAPLHVRMHVSVSAQSLVRLYEDTAVSANGSALPIRNRKRTATRTAQAVSIFRAPTITSDGTVLFEGFVPGGERVQATGAHLSVFQEWIFKPNANYMIRLTNTSGGNEDISVGIDHYEP